MRRLIFCGDAACESGFAKATHAYLDVLSERFEVDVIGLNYDGRPHPYDAYRIWPAKIGGDGLGVNMINNLVDRVGPDVVVVMNDPWNLPHYTLRVNAVPVVGIVAVGGKNCRGAGLNGLRHAIFWTQFGLDEARLGGYRGPASIVPLGVDVDVFRPQDRQYARQRLGIRADRVPPGSFLVGNVNRNQPRKRLDLTILYFAEWVKTRGIDDAFLYLHVAPTGDMGYDCAQLAAYADVSNRLIMCEPSVWHGSSAEGLALTHAACDVLVSTSQDEGWSLPTMEAMACGVPTLVPHWAALGEWPGEAAVRVPCSAVAASCDHMNVIGGVVDREGFIASLDRLYRDPAYRKTMGLRGHELVRQPRYRWRAIGERVADVVEDALAPITVGARAEVA